MALQGGLALLLVPALHEAFSMQVRRRVLSPPPSAGGGRPGAPAPFCSSGCSPWCPSWLLTWGARAEGWLKLQAEQVPTLPRPVNLDHGESANHGLVSVTSLSPETNRTRAAWSPAGSAPLPPVHGPEEAGWAFPGLISRELQSTQFPENISYLSLTSSSSRPR